jgi:hypothetical protein
MRATKPMAKDGLEKQVDHHKRVLNNNTKLEVDNHKPNPKAMELLVKEPVLLPLLSNTADLKLETEELLQTQATQLEITSSEVELLHNKSNKPRTQMLPP